MKIEELMQKATHLPTIKFRPTGTDISTAQNYTVYDVPQPNGMSSEEWQCNKARLEHCLNNFGPMLEALKECEGMIRTAFIEDSMTTIYRAQEAIEAASTVEV